MKKAFQVFCYTSVIGLGLLGLFDLIFFIQGGAGETLSYRFWVLSKQWPLVPFSLGFICAHLVWQYNPNDIQG